jgi:hypothetical protein
MQGHSIIKISLGQGHQKQAWKSHQMEKGQEKVWNYQWKVIQTSGRVLVKDIGNMPRRAIKRKRGTKMSKILDGR